MYQKALVAVDGSQPSFDAVAAARDLAQAGSVKAILLIHVINIPNIPVVADTLGMTYIPPHYPEELLAFAQQVLDQARELLGPQIPVQTEIEYGSPAEIILQVIEKQHCDLVIIGNRGLGGLQRLLLGSVSGHVVSHAPCSVLVVK